MPDVFDERIKKAIPAMIYMFSGADDAQQACDVSNVKGFNLPDPAGKSGGACTSALLQTLWRDDDDDDVRYSWAETLELMREKIEEIGLTQVPQLSTSRPIDVNEEIVISNPTSGEGDDESEIGEGGVGVKRAMLVGVNYTGEPNALTSCHNDVRNMKDFLMQVHGFQRENMLVLMDDGKHHEPTKQLIMDGLKKLCEISRPGDSIFFQFSGHGGQMKDRDGDEEDGYDEILIPGDYKESGQIVDDEIYQHFVTQVPPGVHVVAMIDCCHSGTAMDLPYVCNVGDGAIHPKDGYRPIAITGAELVPKKKKDKESTKKKDKTTKGKKSKAKDKDADQAADTVDNGKSKKGKKSKSTKKKVAKEEEREEHYEEEEGDDMVETVDDEEDEGYEEVERVEPKKKKIGIFGFGRRKK